MANDELDTINTEQENDGQEKKDSGKRIKLR